MVPKYLLAKLVYKTSNYLIEVSTAWLIVSGCSTQRDTRRIAESRSLQVRDTIATSHATVGLEPTKEASNCEVSTRGAKEL